MSKNNQKKIYLGGACFWCIEAAFGTLKGISSATSGYMGGDLINPTYESVCQGDSGHAEVVEIIFDVNLIPLESVLDVFFEIHDPTSLNRQGNDIGSQYRSIIFCTSKTQYSEVCKYITILEKNLKFAKPIVTELLCLESEAKNNENDVNKKDTFFPAEEHHQNYFQNNRENPYCELVIRNKVSKAKKALTNR